MGIEPFRHAIQRDSMDDALRTGLWNACTIYWNQTPRNKFLSTYAKENKDRRLLDMVERLWSVHLKKPLDKMDDYWSNSYDDIRKEFLFNIPWNKVYEFVEFLASNYADESVNAKFMQECNAVLKREASAYRFISGIIAPIVSDTEISEVEKAIADAPLKSISDHLTRALELLADRKSPDYRNSIKESISAVEALCKAVANSPNATLSAALAEVESKQILRLHPSLKAAFDRLYGYTSSAEGIRHALMDQASLDVEDAMFMLVACSAFANYLKSKATKAGIDLKLVASEGGGDSHA